MEPHRRFHTHAILFSLSLLFAVGCVSVNLKPKTAVHSTEYKFQPPVGPFRKIANEQTDIAWQNEKTGNTIAVLSECSESRDPSLSNLEAEVSGVLNESKIIKSENLTFEDRAALRSLIEGKIDGVSASVDVLTFKKNSCAYTLTYMGRSLGFEKDRSVFETFLKGFKVQ